MNFQDKGISLIFKALEFATQKHEGQVRKGSGEPYISHPIDVANILYKHKIFDPEIIAAALLHDVIEDTNATHEELEAIFPPKVIEYVLEVTDDKSLPKRQIKQEQIRKAKEEWSVEACQIKIADKISNIRDLDQPCSPNWSPEKKFGYVLWSVVMAKNAKGKKNPNPSQSIDFNRTTSSVWSSDLAFELYFRAFDFDINHLTMKYDFDVDKALENFYSLYQ